MNQNLLQNLRKEKAGQREIELFGLNSGVGFGSGDSPAFYRPHGGR